MRSLPLKHVLTGIGILAIAGLSWWVYYTFFTFHITYLSPKAPSFPTSSNFVLITFNRPLQQNSYKEEMVSLNQKIKHTVNFEGSSIRVKLTTQPADKTRLIVTLKDIPSSSGDRYSGTVNYTVTYVPFDQLSKDQQQQQVATSDSFEKDYPLLNNLPITTSKYSIDYNLPQADNVKMPVIISMNFGPNSSSDNGVPTKQDMDAYRDQIRQYRTEAISRLTALGFDKKLYQLYFSENELINEFDGKYVGELVYAGD